MTDNAMTKDEAALEGACASPKKAYVRPALTKLGAFHDVTLSVSQSGNRDNNSRGRNDRTGRGGLAGLGALPRDSAS